MYNYKYFRTQKFTFVDKHMEERSGKICNKWIRVIFGVENREWAREKRGEDDEEGLLMIQNVLTY